RMIRGDSGEDLVGAQQAMQTKQAAVEAEIVRAAQFDDRGLAAAFTAVVDAQATGERVRFVFSIASLAVVLLLSVWISRGLYRSLEDLGIGFRRFGEGKLDAAIPTTDDELGAVAKDANQMAERLRLLGEERERVVWLRAGQIGLATELRGELEPHEVADRAIAFLARYLGVPAGIIHYESANVFRALGGYGVTIDPAATIAAGTGLVGEAARRTEITVVAAPAGHIPIRSGFAIGDPRALVFVPLVHNDRVRGVVELAILAEWIPTHEELMLAVRDSITIAIEVASTRTATRTLLDETQRQATELLAARRGLEQKAEELARASAYKSQFLASMSHELRTPLNAIIGFSELMYDGAIALDSPKSHEFLGDILTSGRHLLQLINDVLDLSKVEAGKFEFFPVRTEMSTVIAEVIGILKTTAAKNRVGLVTVIGSDADEVVLDPARIKQVLYNYLSNALKFTPAGGRIEVRTLVEGEAIRIEVEDTGVGISEADLAKLFADFQQTREGMQYGGGTGLGLALTKRLVEAQGGTVGVRSVVGKGSIFHAVLPRVMTGVEPPSLAIPRPGAPTVLVIEDDAIDRECLVRALQLAGYAIEAVATGRQAIERCNERVYDAITLDLLLPDMTGLEVLQRLHTNRNPNERVPILIVTVVAERGAVAGFAVHDVLAKPLDDGALLASLGRCGVDPAGGNVVLVIDDDPAASKVMQTTLQRLGYFTICESDGEAGLRTARAAQPSAIVLDLVMPVMSGFEFLDQLRGDPAGRQLPVIVWTSKDLSAEECAVLRTSANAVVAKGRDASARVVAELASVLPVEVS
ncbi:MAG: response regulator, partial [Kofleriaceae bacterium]